MSPVNLHEDLQLATVILLLNRRCTRLPGCIRLQNDLYSGGAL